MSDYRLSDKYNAIVIGGSAGSFQPITRLLAKLPKDFPLPIFLCLHRLKHVRHGFEEALSIKSSKKVQEPEDKELIRSGAVYLAPANYHMAIELGNSVALSTETLINNSRPSIDVTFESASYVYKDSLVAILLSGANKDGAAGISSVKARGGLTIIQSLDECMISTMPAAAKDIAEIDYELTSDEIINFLLELYKHYT
ncbi:chemotaxis protein CheB [Limibacter armeniacum]|uniref:chemotaxis protein CheB n=1 Tax=Limibacter armeniacum TaxID=466084 RepID=UPI002FE6BB53